MPVLGVQPRRAADGDQVERPVIEERLERVAGDAAVPGGELLGVRARRRVDRGDVDAGNGGNRTRVRVADVAGADQSDVDHRGLNGP